MNTRKEYFKLALLSSLLTGISLSSAFIFTPSGLVLVALIGLAAIFAGIVLVSLFSMIFTPSKDTLSTSILAVLIAFLFN